MSDPAPSDSLSATASAPPSVAAGMKEITSVEGFTVHIPKTYQLSIDEKDGFNSRDTVDDFRELAMSAIPVASGADPLAETRGYFYADNGFVIRPKTLKPVTVAGVKMFHVAGMIDSVAWLEGFGVQTEDYVYQIKFIFQERTTPAKERRAVVESVLSTMELR
ncbi:hypothetical protein [Nocardioides salsibiostraticola]